MGFEATSNEQVGLGIRCCPLSRTRFAPGDFVRGGIRMTSKPRLIIVGGSAAGPSAAAKAKRVNADLEVMIFEKGDFVSYGS